MERSGPRPAVHREETGEIHTTGSSSAPSPTLHRLCSASIFASVPSPQTCRRRGTTIVHHHQLPEIEAGQPCLRWRGRGPRGGCVHEPPWRRRRARGRRRRQRGREGSSRRGRALPLRRRPALPRRQQRAGQCAAPGGRAAVPPSRARSSSGNRGSSAAGRNLRREQGTPPARRKGAVLPLGPESSSVVL
jgi:hypothetical protein